MKLLKKQWLWIILVIIHLPLLAQIKNPYDQYYLPTDKPRWQLATDAGPVEGRQNGRYLAPQDFLPGRFEMRGTIVQLTEDYFDFKHDNCAWGEFTYRIKPSPKIKHSDGAKTIDAINSPQLSFDELSNVEQLNLKGEISHISKDKELMQVKLNFAGKADIMASMQVVKKHKEKRSPEVRNRHYGPHWKHAFDIYYPQKKINKPLAAVVFIHGGGWSANDKAARGQVAEWFNEHGMAYISVNYRYVSMRKEHPATKPPVAASLLDAARAIQFIRYHAKELNIDPNRMGFTGGSAGGATCTWLALHDDLALHDAEDPIARMSTKPTCVVPVQAQTSIDPKIMQEWIPSITYGAHAFFDREILPEDRQERFQFFLNKREEILPWIEEFSSYRHASADDPPILLNYLTRENKIPAKDNGDATHHARFGVKLHEKLVELGVDSHFMCEDDTRSENYTNWFGEKVFFVDKLNAHKEAGM